MDIKQPVPPVFAPQLKPAIKNPSNRTASEWLPPIPLDVPAVRWMNNTTAREHSIQRTSFLQKLVNDPSLNGTPETGPVILTMLRTAGVNLAKVSENFLTPETDMKLDQAYRQSALLERRIEFLKSVQSGEIPLTPETLQQTEQETEQAKVTADKAKSDYQASQSPVNTQTSGNSELAWALKKAEFHVERLNQQAADLQGLLALSPSERATRLAEQIPILEGEFGQAQIQATQLQQTISGVLSVANFANSTDNTRSLTDPSKISTGIQALLPRINEQLGKQIVLDARAIALQDAPQSVKTLDTKLTGQPWPNNTTIAAASEQERSAFGNDFFQRTIQHLGKAHSLPGALQKTTLEGRLGASFQFPQHALNIQKGGWDKADTTKDRKLILVQGEAKSLAEEDVFDAETQQMKTQIQTAYNLPEDNIIVLKTPTKDELARQIAALTTENGQNQEVAIILNGHGDTQGYDPSVSTMFRERQGSMEGLFALNQKDPLTESDLKAMVRNNLSNYDSVLIINNSCHSGAWVAQNDNPFARQNGFA